MAVKNFVFRENRVGSKVADMKTTFFAIFDPTLTHSLAPKDPNKEFLKACVRYFSLFLKEKKHFFINSNEVH